MYTYCIEKYYDISYDTLHKIIPITCFKDFYRNETKASRIVGYSKTVVFYKNIPNIRSVENETRLLMGKNQKFLFSVFRVG